MADTFAIEGIDLTRSFSGFFALSGVNIAVPPGEIRGLIGPNGAGKSTLIDVLSGRAQRWSGEVKMFGNRYRQPCRRSSAATSGSRARSSAPTFSPI